MERISQEQSLNYRKLNAERDFAYGMSSAVAFTLSPVEEGWESVQYYGEAFTDPTGSAIKPHWIYIMVNPSMPNLCKIGYTTTSIAQRVAELTAQTASITPWYSVYSYKCPDGRSLEREIHTYLEDRGFRVNPKREGFYISSEAAIQVIEELGEKYKTK
jgi:hypothetical protein